MAVVVTNWAMFDYGEFDFDLGVLGIFNSNDQVIVRDLFSHSDLGTFSGSFKVEKIPAFGSHAFRIRKAPQTFMQ
jgi:hypothetical protein